MLILHHRNGFVGFMLTMALGVALGAATLVVSNEVIKGAKKEGTKPATSQSSPFKDRANALKVAWKNYDQTRQAYEDALAQRSPDVATKRETMLRAKRILERAILGATPGLRARGRVPCGCGRAGTRLSSVGHGRGRKAGSGS
ncbi:MAG TPA: hypothetical protein PKO06_24090, partial [Candidatus Ozemobacteraceae bacterium]|nr:hypothetical protein [Candidatus Ozemobacteraceae bacterium]